MYQQVIDNATEKMKKTTSVFQTELRSIRAGRANPQLLDRVMVDYYGVQTPLNQMGNVSSPEPRMLAINVCDPKALPLVEKAILKSDLVKKLEKDSQITEDDRAKAEKKIQEKTDEAIKGVDTICAQKEKEIMEV